MKKKYFSAALFIAAAFIILAASCGKNVVDDSGNNGTAVTIPETSDPLLKQYTMEGFIDKSTFRVVIIGTKEECETDENIIEKKSKTRAISTLLKYLASQGKNNDDNARAGILNLMSEFGKFYKKDSGCSKTNIYYYELKKDGIKGQVLNIGGQR